MKLDPVLLSMGCSYSMKAYDDRVKDSIKIESKLTSTTVFIAKRKTIDVIAFRGSQQPVDFFFDGFAVPMPYAGRFCHGGFVMALKSVWDEIEPHIDYSKRTLVCGHSLGGALAELACSKIHNKHPNLNLVTFGKPNTFFKGFKRPMKLDCQISVVHGSDLVPRVPRILYGPSSSQTQLYFTNSGEFKINPTKALKRKDFLSEPDECVSDHFMAGYKKSLDGFLAKAKDKADEIKAAARKSRRKS